MSDELKEAEVEYDVYIPMPPKRIYNIRIMVQDIVKGRPTHYLWQEQAKMEERDDDA